MRTEAEYESLNRFARKCAKRWPNGRLVHCYDYDEYNVYCPTYYWENSDGKVMRVWTSNASGWNGGQYVQRKS